MPAAAIGVALLAAGGIAAGMLGPWRTPLGPPPVQRVSISIPGAATYAARAGGGLAVAPDGSRLVYVALTEDGTRQLYLRGIDRLDPVAMPGTEGAWNPFFSPNGEWIGFFTDPVTGRGLLKKVAVAGGPPQTLCAAEIPTGSWSGDDQIVFAEFVGEGVASLFRVSAAGGTPEPVTTLEPDVNEQHVWPDVLPGDRAAVYSVYVNGASRVDLVSFETGETRTLLDSGVNPRYIESGHIVFMQDSTLMAVPFDLDDLDVTGVPAPVVEGVLTGTSIGGEASVAVSDSGLLVYARGSSAAIVTGPEARRLVWVDRQGQEQPLPTPERFFRYPRVSPDGQRVAVVVGTGNAESANVDLWVYDVETGAGLRLTYEGVNRLPIWTSDGQYVVFSSTMDAPPPDGLTGGWWGNVYRVPADGSGPPERLTTSDDSQALTAVTPDGQTMLYTKIIDNPGRWDITRVSARSDDAPEPVVSGPFQQGSGALSPDGRWLAYRSDETGQFEVYVQPYPGPGPKTPVSVGGGRGTVWAQDGSELFFRVQNRVVAVEVEHEPTFSAGAARTVLDGPYIAADSADGRQYHVAPDGRFLMLKPANISDDAGVPDQFVAVLNWFEELTERVPTR